MLVKSGTQNKNYSFFTNNVAFSTVVKFRLTPLTKKAFDRIAKKYSEQEVKQRHNNARWICWQRRYKHLICMFAENVTSDNVAAANQHAYVLYILPCSVAHGKIKSCLPSALPNGKKRSSARITKLGQLFPIQWRSEKATVERQARRAHGAFSPVTKHHTCFHCSTIIMWR